jgi:uncharacterized CHY-type Zn-finger protein
MDRPEFRRALARLRSEMLTFLDRREDDTDFCGRCHLPLPAGDFESYCFCPWCDLSITGNGPCLDESRRIIEHSWETEDDIQCGECGAEYSQPSRYPFRFCPCCGAPFAEQDELLIELPFLVGGRR